MKRSTLCLLALTVLISGSARADEAKKGGATKSTAAAAAAQTAAITKKYLKELGDKFGYKFANDQTKGTLTVTIPPAATFTIDMKSVKSEDEIEAAIISGAGALIERHGLADGSGSVYYAAGGTQQIFQGAVAEASVAIDKAARDALSNKAQNNSYRIALDLPEGVILMPGGQRDLRHAGNGIEVKRVIIRVDEQSYLIATFDFNGYGYERMKFTPQGAPGTMTPENFVAPAAAVTNPDASVYRQVNDLLKKSPAGKKDKDKEKDLDTSVPDKAVGALQEKLKGSTLDEMGLKALYDKSKAAKPGDDSWKQGATPDQLAAVDAVNSGKVVGTGPNMRFEYTPQQGGVIRHAIVVAPNMQDTDLQATAKAAAGDIVGGNDKLAQFKAAAAALTGAGAVKKDDPAPPVVDPAARPIDKPQNLPVADIAGPSAATGLKSGCGNGKTLADYKKAQADKVLAKDADQSAERQDLEAQYKDKLAAAKSDLDSKVPPQKDWETDDDYQKRVNANPTAKKAFEDANAAADAWYKDQQKKLGSRQAQSAKTQQALAKSGADSEEKLRGQIRSKVESLRTDFGRSGSDSNGEQVEAAMARTYVTPDSWAKQLGKNDVDAYFADQWPADQKGAKPGAETGNYKKNLDWCFNGQVRVDNGSDVENCVGALLGSYLKDRADRAKKAPKSPKTSTADARRQAIERAQRCQELGLPDTCTDADMQKKAGPQ